MTRLSRRIALAAALAAPLATVILAAPATAAAGYPTAAGRPADLLAAVSRKPALAGYFATTETSNTSYDSAGGTVTVTSSVAGTYTVEFPGLGGIHGGNVQVTSGTVGATCSIANWEPFMGGLQVNIFCWSFGGGASPSHFSVLVTQPRSKPHGVLDYDLIVKKSKSYTLTGPDQYNSSGKHNSVRHLGTGRYEVKMPGPAPSGAGTVKVSSYGGGPGDCQLRSWNGTSSGTEAFVDCYSAMTHRQDKQFTIVYARDNNLMGQNGKTDANAFAGRDKAAVYQPRVQFDSHHGAAVTVSRFSKGLYLVLFAGSQGSPHSKGGGGDLQVTAEAKNDVHCAVEGWMQQFTPVAEVYCTDNNGNATDAAMTVQWVVA